MRKLISQTNIFFTNASLSEMTTYMGTIAHQKYMKINIIEDTNYYKEETFNRVVDSCFNQALPMVLLRQALTH